MMRVRLFVSAFILTACGGPQLGVGAVTLEPGGVRVELVNVKGRYQRACTNASRLGLLDGGTFIDETPRCGSQPYFIDGTFFENPDTLGCLGCDLVVCSRLATEAQFSTIERRRTGSRARPDGGADVPEVTSSSAPAPWLLEVRTYADAMCAGDAQLETFVVREP